MQIRHRSLSTWFCWQRSSGAQAWPCLSILSRCQTSSFLSSPLATTLDGALHDGLAEAVMSINMAKPCQLAALNCREKWFLGAHIAQNFAPNIVIGAASSGIWSQRPDDPSPKEFD